MAGRQKENADKFAEKYGIPAAYGSYEEMAKDPRVGEFTGSVAPTRTLQGLLHRPEFHRVCCTDQNFTGSVTPTGISQGLLHRPELYRVCCTDQNLIGSAAPTGILQGLLHRPEL